MLFLANLNTLYNNRYKKRRNNDNIGDERHISNQISNGGSQVPMTQVQFLNIIQQFQTKVDRLQSQLEERNQKLDGLQRRFDQIQRRLEISENENMKLQTTIRQLRAQINV